MGEDAQHGPLVGRRPLQVAVRGEVRAGSVERVAVPLTAALQGFVTLMVSGAITADRIGQSLDDTVAVLLRGYAP
ncbi:hypothetical protein [Streptomyces sp. A012304]|uniref:hypothetical protein n=1 Tax=Streptomyces sp. A012304 TaxID=375446 RepID=UPI00222F5EBC|nr:hypothetical protein [Streptomyces sp. A012304]